ncbi:hypothetical protein IWW50_004426 [Coemansia erecta]|nr:hypothetical protein IWW50_004426 [Coemansia erecta]
MPVSSLTSEQRTKVMSEIQRIRNSTASAARPATPTSARTGAKPAGTQSPRPPLPASRGAAQHSRPRPLLPSIAPRSILPVGPGGPRSAPVAGSLSAPGTPPNGLSRLAQTPGSRRPQSGQAPLPESTQKAALVKMYQSAYLCLQRRPAEVLRKLDPPVELSSLIEDGSVGNPSAPDSLLVIIKALTRAQAMQLAHMYDTETRSGRPADINTDMLPSAPNSQPQSGEVSPAGSYMSGTERDFLELAGSGAATPTKRRKYNKTGKYSVKNRAMWAPGSPRDDTPSPRARHSGAYPYGDAVRVPAAAERPKQPQLTKHEAEISRRFGQALAMDHKMVQAPDWQTPFSGTRDMIQRLLPFHVFQYPDSAIDTDIAREEQRAGPVAEGLDKRARALAQRYNKMLEREGAGGCYAPDFIQLDRQRISALSEELEHMDDARLQRDISSVGGGLFW